MDNFENEGENKKYIIEIIALILIVASLKFLGLADFLFSHIKSDKRLGIALLIIINVLYVFRRYLWPVLNWKKGKEKYDGDENSVNVMFYISLFLRLVTFLMIIFAVVSIALKEL